MWISDSDARLISRHTPLISHASTAVRLLGFFHFLIARPFHFFRTKHYGETPTVPLNMGFERKLVMKKKSHSRRIVCFVSETIQDRSIVIVERTPVGTRKRSIKCCQFQWLWITPNPDFKGRPLFDIEYNINFFLLPTKFLQPVNLAILTIWSLFNPLAVPAPHLLSHFLGHQPYSLKITDRSFRYASPRHWNQLPNSFRQPRQSRLDSPPHSLVSSSLLSSPLSSSITHSLFHSRLKTYLFNKSFPP